MKTKSVLAWAIPALVFAAAGFVALLKGPRLDRVVERTYGAFVDYGASTVG